MNIIPKRGEIFWVNLEPTVGTEINKIRPCLIISNDSSNEYLSRVIVAPITSTIKKLYSFEVKLELENLIGKILLDQIRSIDKRCLGNRITFLEKNTMMEVDKALKITLALI